MALTCCSLVPCLVKCACVVPYLVKCLFQHCSLVPCLVKCACVVPCLVKCLFQKLLENRKKSSYGKISPLEPRCRPAELFLRIHMNRAMMFCGALVCSARYACGLNFFCSPLHRALHLYSFIGTDADATFTELA